MKKINIDSLINSKLEEENGIPFKEEYWDSMSSMLSTQMPITQSPLNSFTSFIKSAFKSTKFYVIIATLTCLSWLVVYTVKDAPQKTNIALTTTLNETSIQTATSNASAKTNKHNIPINSRNKQQAAITILTPNAFVEPNEEAKKANKKDAQKGFKQNNMPHETKSSTTLLVAMNEETEDLDNINLTTTTRQTQFNFNTITSLPYKIKLSKLAYQQTPQALPNQPNQHTILTGLSIAPFVGMVFETGPENYQNGNISYTHPAQSNFVFGLNFEALFNQFALRSGISLSNSLLNSTQHSTEDKYSFDTSYVVVNPNYGSTVSGKPVALIQRKVDSTFLITQESSSQESTKYQLLSVPITLQYHIHKNRFALVLEGGSLHHFRVAQQSSTTSQINNPENKQMLPAYQWQFTGGASVRYQINVNWAMGVQYNYLFDPKQSNKQLINNGHQANLMLIRNIW